MIVFVERDQLVEMAGTLVVSCPAGQNAEHPQIMIEPGGRAVVVFRHWTRRVSRAIGSVMAWENYVTTFQITNWSAPRSHGPSV